MRYDTKSFVMLDGYGRDLADEEDDRKDKTRILASTVPRWWLGLMPNWTVEVVCRLCVGVLVERQVCGSFMRIKLRSFRQV